MTCCGPNSSDVPVVAVDQHRAFVAVAVAGELEIHPEVLEHRNEALAHVEQDRPWLSLGLSESWLPLV